MFRPAFCQLVSHQQIQHAARLPEDIAKEIALFAANLIDHFPESFETGASFHRESRLFGVITVLRTPAGKGLRVITPVAGIHQLLFFF
ncbi:hypothetical protein D3C78_1611670 [compost metagenome]